MKNISYLQNQTNSVSLWRTVWFIRWGLGEYCITLWEYSNWTTILRLCCFRQCSIKIYWKKKIDAVVRGGLLGGWMWVGGWKETPWCWSPGMRHARKLARLAPNQMPSVPPPHPTSTTTTTSTTLPLLSHECHVPSPTPPFSPHSSLSLSPPQPMKQESRHLRFLRQDQRSLCPGLRTDGIPSPCCCCCCWPAVAAGIQNRSLTSAWLLEYANIPRIKGTQRMDTYALTKANSFIRTDTEGPFKRRCSDTCDMMPRCQNRHDDFHHIKWRPSHSHVRHAALSAVEGTVVWAVTRIWPLTLIAHINTNDQFPSFAETSPQLLLDWSPQICVQTLVVHGSHIEQLNYFELLTFPRAVFWSWHLLFWIKYIDDVKMDWHERSYIHGPQRMNPTEFGDSATFDFVPSLGQKLLILQNSVSAY